MLDPSIYSQVGNFPSFQDLQAQTQQLATNKLQQMLMQNQVSQLPVMNQMQQLQLRQADIGNQMAQNKLGMIQNFMARLNGGQGAGQPQGPTSPSAALGQAASATGQAGPTQAAAQIMNGQGGQSQGPQQGGQQSGLGAIDPNTMFAGELAGMVPEGATKLWMEAKYGRPMQPGYRQNIDGSTSYFGDPTKGITLDPATGQVVQMPGAGAALGGIAQATKTGEVAGTNSGTLLPLGYIGANSHQPLGGTIGAYLGQPAPGQQPAAQGAPGGFAMPTPMDQLPPAGRAAVMADMAKTGVDPATATVNGVAGGALGGTAQQQIDAAKAAGPQALHILARTIASSINSSSMPPQAKAQALDGLQYNLYTPPGTPIHAFGAAGSDGAPPQGTSPVAGGAPPIAGGAPMGGGAPGGGLAGPADIAAAEVNAKNQAEMATGVPLKAAQQTATSAATAGQAYQDKLNTTVQEGLGQIRTNNEIMAQLQDYNAGIGSADTRTTVAKNLANLFPNDARIQAVAQQINGGSVVSAQTLHNLTVGASIRSAITTLQGQGKLNRSEVQAFTAAAENPETDPGAIARITAIQNKFVGQSVAEQQALSSAISDGTYNPSTWPAKWSQIQYQGLTDPTHANPLFAPATPTTQASTGFKYLGKQ